MSTEIPGLANAQYQYDHAGDVRGNDQINYEREAHRVVTEINRAFEAALPEVKKGIAFHFDDGGTEVSERHGGYWVDLGALYVRRVYCDGNEVDDIGKRLIELGKQLLRRGNHA